MMNNNQLDNHNTTEPVAPDSLPDYLTDGVKRQDIDTLFDLTEYVDDVIAYRSQSVSTDDLPPDAEQITELDTQETMAEDGGDEMKTQGTVVKELVRCGDNSCACMSKDADKSDKHGPCLYRYYYKNGGPDIRVSREIVNTIHMSS